MKVKKVFAIIGIVTGCIMAFVGGVFGVMAAMGKFKTPVVHPEEIFFENEEEVIVAQYKDDQGKDVIYSFMLTGENDSIDYPVNVKDCYLSFVDRTGVDLIQLCDKNGQPLQPDNKGRYNVECNENVYYKLKEVDETIAPDPTSLTNGKVVLKARTADNLHNSTNNKIIWIDRNVTSVFLKYGNIPHAMNTPTQNQIVNIALDTPVIFDYVVNPEISWQPISKESKKIVELYYDDPKTEDFVLVSLENIKNTNYSLNEIFDAEQTEQTGSLVFKSSKATVDVAHKFKIAMFPNYQAREEYLANPAYASDTNATRLERGMIVTDLSVNVVNTNVDSVSMGSGIVNLQLYSQDNFIHLRNNTAEENNLNVVMKSNGVEIDVRLDEIDFNLLSNEEKYHGYPKFVRKNNVVGELNEIDFEDYPVYSYRDKNLKITGINEDCTVESIIKIGDYDVISSLTIDGVQYFCENGIVLIKSTEGIVTVKLLNAGSYLDFYVYNNGTYTLAAESDITYSFEAEKNGVNKKWNVVVESYNASKTLVLGLMVANNSGVFDADNMFVTKLVEISENLLSYEKLNSSATLNLIAEEKKPFSYFYQIGGGTYTACLMVVKESDIKDKAVVEYVKNAYFEISGEKYYIVGDYVGEVYTNSVIAKNNDKLTKDSENILYLLQLKNSYNQTVESLIADLLKGKDLRNPVALDVNFVKQLRNNEKVTISQKLLLDEESVITAEILGVAQQDNVYNLYEKIDYTLSISSAYIKRLVTFYGLSVDNIKDYLTINYNGSIHIKCIKEEGTDKLNVKFETGDVILGNPDVILTLTNVFTNGASKELVKINIVSTAPESIVYNRVENDENPIVLTDKDSADIETVDVVIGWDGNSYSYAWGTSLTLNLTISGSIDAGFQDPNFKVTHGITYGVEGSSIQRNGTNLEVVGVGESYLSVTIAGVTKWLKINVTAPDFALTQKANTITGSNGNLSNLISYTYDSNSIYNANLVTLTNFDVQHGQTLRDANPSENTYTWSYGEGADIKTVLTISKTASGDWTFIRTNDVYSALSVAFNVVTKTGTITVSVTFEQDVIHDLNVASWGTDIKLYQGTTILLYEEVNGTGDFTKEALIEIRDKGDNDIKLYENETELSEEMTLSSLGEHNITIKIGEVVIGNYSFTVVPNVIVEQVAGNNVLASGLDNANVSSFVKFYSYATTDIVYGQTIGEDSKIILYSTDSDDIKSDITNLDSLSFISEGDMVTKAPSAGAKVNTAWITKIGAAQEVTVNVYSNSTKVGEFTAIVENQYQIQSKVTIGDDKVLNIKAMTNINDWLEVAGFTITNVEWKYSTADENLTFENSDEMIPELNVIYENVTLLLTLSDGTNTLEFEGNLINGENIKINIVPYELDEAAGGIKAYSEREFNLLTGVYEEDGISEKYKSIKVKSVKDESGNSLTNTTLGYIYNGLPADGYNITFNKINDDFIKAFIEYEVVYKDGKTYTYTKEITLQNWQELTETYPEQDSSLCAEGIDLTLISKDETYSYTGNYEPILINVNEGAKINLLNDENKHINRISAKDRETDIDIEPNDIQIESMYVYAYQNSYGIKNYVDNITFNVSKGEVILPASSQGIYGLIVIRLVSVSGNYSDYYINVCGNGNNTTISANTTANVNVQPGTDTIATIVNKVNGNNFIGKFGTNSTDVKMFLLNATTLADDNKEYKDVVYYIAEEENPLRIKPGNKVYITGYTDVASMLVDVTDYTTLILSLVKFDIYSIYPIGIITLYLRPEGERNAPGTDDVIKSSNLAIDGIYNGEYTATIDANAESVASPFVGFTIDYYEDEENNKIYNISDERVTTTDGSTLKLSKTTESYSFDVFYTNGTITLKVTYTYLAVEIPKSTLQTVGELSVDTENDDNTKFLNTVTIDDTFFGTYQGVFTINGVEFTIASDNKITAGGVVASSAITYIDNTDENVSYSIDGSGVLILTFTQGLQQYEQELDFVFTDAGAETRTWTFNVLPGFKIEANRTDNSGTSEAQRKLTTLAYIDDSELSATGSTLEITKRDINKVGNNYYGAKFVVGGYTIYVNDKSASIKFDFTNDTDNYVLNHADNEFSANGDIEFAHLASELEFNTSFKVLNSGDKEFVGSSTNLFLKLAQTYTGITPVYVTTPKTIDATYAPTVENVLSGDANKLTLFDANNTANSYLFTAPSAITNVTNPSRLSVQVRKYNSSTEKFEIVNISSGFYIMGFVTQGNPNFIEYTVNSNAIISKEGENSIITFATVNKNEDCPVILSNKAGMSSLNYNFQIMNDTVKDGISFSKDGYVDETDEYISYVVNDDDSSQAYTTGELNIGKLKDAKNHGIYVTIGGSTEFIPNTANSSKTFGNYTVYLKNGNISFEYRRNAGVSCLPDKTDFSISIHGSTDYVLENYTIVLFNKTIEYATSRDTTPYGGEKLNLQNKLELPEEYTEYTGDGSDWATIKSSLYEYDGTTNYTLTTDTEYNSSKTYYIKFVTLEIDWDNSKYGLTQNPGTVLGETNEFVSFALERGVPTLITQSVGQDVYIDLIVKVKIGGYYINSVAYKFMLNRNYQFFFNGATPTGNWKPNDVSEFTTNFVLTNYDTSTDPDTTYTFSNMSYSFSSSIAVGNAVSDSSTGKTYYSELAWSVYNYTLGSKIGGVAIQIGQMSDSKYKINDDGSELQDLAGNVILKVYQDKIVFLQDFNDTLQLQLSITCANNTTYSVTWNIVVSGFIKLTPQSSEKEVITKSGAAFDSGNQVNIVNTGIGAQGLGILAKDMTNVFGMTSNDQINYDEVKLKDEELEYVIIKYDSSDGLTNAERFANATAKTITDSSTTLTKEQTLPIVPSTTKDEKYLVIYKFSLNYLDYTTQTYYVAYLVVNNINIQVTSFEDDSTDPVTTLRGDNINVNTRLEDNKYLDLFYYAETYTDNDSNKYTIYYEGPDAYKVDIDLDSGTEENNLSCEISNISSNGQITLTYTPTGGSETTVNLTKDKTATIKYFSDKDTATPSAYYHYSVFTVDFNNITEFGAFIGSIDIVKIGDKFFDLNHRSNGRWGIDLATRKYWDGDSWETDTADTEDLFNNKLEDASLSLMDENGTAIYTLNAYNPDTATGLRMYSTNSLSPAGSQKLSTLFRSGDVQGDWDTIKDYDIVGVYGGSQTLSTDWVENATGIAGTATAVSGVTITVGDYAYTLQTVIFTGSGGVSGICSVSDTFYVIQASETGGAIYKSNHDAGQLLTLNASGEMSLADMFVKYVNDATTGALVEQSVSIHSNVVESGTDTGVTATVSDAKMTVSGLQAYKNANPTKTTVKVGFKFTIDTDKTLYAEFTFKLPADVVVSAEQSSVNEIDITSLSVPVYDAGGNLSYQKLKDISVSPQINNLTSVTGIVENSTSYTAENGINKAEGTITLDGTKVGEYFTANTSATSLKISYTLTITTNGKTATLDFVIVVNKTITPAS